MPRDTRAHQIVHDFKNKTLKLPTALLGVLPNDSNFYLKIFINNSVNSYRFETIFYDYSKSNNSFFDNLKDSNLKIMENVRFLFLTFLFLGNSLVQYAIYRTKIFFACLCALMRLNSLSQINLDRLLSRINSTLPR